MIAYKGFDLIKSISPIASHSLIISSQAILTPSAWLGLNNTIHLSSTIHHSQSNIHHLPSNIHYLPSAIHSPPSTIHPSIAGRVAWSPFDVAADAGLLRRHNRLADLQRPVELHGIARPQLPDRLDEGRHAAVHAARVATVGRGGIAPDGRLVRKGDRLRPESGGLTRRLTENPKFEIRNKSEIRISKRVCF